MSVEEGQRRINQWPHWPNARDWIGFGSFLLTVAVLFLLANFPELRNDEFFQTIATLIIGTGFINGPVSWAYSATKAGGELADKNAKLVETAAVKTTATPQEVVVTNTPADPVPTTDGTTAPTEDKDAPWNGMK